ncbi:hypothetical protein ACOSQ2_013142 [Xanthoceras sorbifolium]
MYNISDMKAPYQAVIRGNWKDLETLFDHDINAFKILFPMTVAKDNAFHMAVHSKTDQPLRYLLERVEQIDDPTGANLLVEKNYVKAEQLLKRNRSGQTPLFKAASFGSTKVVRYLASQPGRTTNTKLEDAHRTRNDGIVELLSGSFLVIFVLSLNKSCLSVLFPTGISILHAAVRGEHFVKKIREEERKRKKLARKLIKNDNSWQLSLTEDPVKYFRSLALERKREITDRKTENSEQVISESAEKQKQTVIAVEDQVPETPLLAATRTGIIEIVREILKEHPQAVEHISHKKQNILHVAASYREREVFELVKEMEIPTSRLILGTEDDSYTVLQHVADTVNYHGGTRYGPAYQLQEELEWFKSVEDIMPSFFTKHRDKQNLTAKELFIEKHTDKLKEAQKWIKQTSHSCSQVAVLVATVVFAAAFTVPGGTDDKNGTPILLNSPFFLFFSISDVISLSSSLTAVVMFLSILTSSFELDDFHRLLPRRLTLGFALLFMSVATTMLAFTSTVILIIHLDKRRQWTLTLICCAACFPVSVLALTHFPLFASFVNALKNLFMAVWEAPPCRLVVGCLASLSNSVRHLLPKKNSVLEKGKD